MNERKLFVPILLVALSIVVHITAWAADPVPKVTQTLNLTPGWNAVYVEVQPDVSTPGTVFSSLPQGSTVWAWTGKNSSVQFIQDPSEVAVPKPKWLNISTSPADSAFNNLYAINANTPYLVKVAGGVSATVTIQGRPTIKHKSWIPDSFNLTGFGFTATPPSFDTFFAPSNSHKKQAIYRLNNTSGIWEMVNDQTTTTMRSGEAFWIYCQSGSDYQGPLGIDAGSADGLDFGAGITVLSMTLNNASNSDKSVSTTQLSSASPVSLAYRSYDSASGKALTNPLSSMPTVTVKAGSSTVITLVAQRGSFSGPAASVLEFADGLGNRIQVPVTAISNPINNYPGLWSGVATLKKVSQMIDSGTTSPFAPGAATDTASELSLNLILHQDSNGQVRLLKQAVVMYQDGTLNVDGTPRTKGRYVVLTQDSLIPNYSGVTQRDGTKVGRRLSAVAIDYSPGTNTDFADTALKCSGSVSTAIGCQLVLESSAAGTHPINPFLHRYHPDHDNLASDFSTFSQEVNRVKRTITMTFDTIPKENANPPAGWGISVLGGAYKESVEGLAKGAIITEGIFTIKLVTDVGLLNQ